MKHLKPFILYFACLIILLLAACDDGTPQIAMPTATRIPLPILDPDVLVDSFVPKSAYELLGVEEVPVRTEAGDGYKIWEAPAEIRYEVSVNGSGIDYIARVISFSYTEDGKLLIEYKLDFSGDTVVTELEFYAYGVMVCKGTAWDFWQLTGGFVKNQTVIKPPTNIRDLRIRECPPTPDEANARATAEAAATATTWASTPEGNRTPEVLGTVTPAPANTAAPTNTVAPTATPTDAPAPGR